jgi:hypothetical protein
MIQKASLYQLNNAAIVYLHFWSMWLDTNLCGHREILATLEFFSRQHDISIRRHIMRYSDAHTITIAIVRWTLPCSSEHVSRPEFSRSRWDFDSSNVRRQLDTLDSQRSCIQVMRQIFTQLNDVERIHLGEIVEMFAA